MIEELKALIETALSTNANLPLTLTFFTAVIVIYSIFVFYFYRFLAKKNIIELNLNQYNQYENPTLVKALAAFFYIIEYIILLPFLTFFWFSIFSTLILLLSKNITIETTLLISAALVASIRITSYVNEDLAKDLAKMLPFTLMAVAITTTGFFDVPVFLNRMSEIPSLFSSIPYYLIFVVIIELIMRITESIHSTFQTSQAEKDED